MINIKRTEERTMIHDILIIDFREAGISSKYQIRLNTSNWYSCGYTRIKSSSKR
jgi:hypothetical protein